MKTIKHSIGSLLERQLQMTQEQELIFKSETLTTFAERGFQPVLKMFCLQLDKYDLQPIEILEGKSISSLRDGLDMPFLKGFFKPYKMDKCEKVCLCNCMLMDRINVCALIIIPDDDYELPMLVLEWSETENTISVVADFIPLADLVMREDYRVKYLDPLDRYWSKYKVLSGMEPNRFAWARMMYSPYYLSGSFSKEIEQNKKDCLDIVKSYLELWVDLRQNAGPIEDADTKKYIKERKTRIREIFRANDEGAKTMAQMVGREVIDLLLLCNF